MALCRAVEIRGSLMIFRNLDENHDFTFGAGKANYTSGNKAIGLNIKTRLLSWVGDCFFDQTAGIDWVNRLGSKNQRTLLELDLRRVTLQSEGVTGLVSFDTILNKREFQAFFEVNTIFTQQFRDQFLLEF